MKHNPSYTGLRKDLLSHIKGQNLKVLDLGCATGMNGKYLIDTGIANYVDGIEFDKVMAEEAQINYNKVFVKDLNKDSLDFINDELNDNFYDAIILGDIIEHLMDPYGLLYKLSLKLKSKGKMIISVPNIAHMELFIQVFLKQTFPNNTRGIFDKTHLRWFTKADVYELIEKLDAFSNIEYYANYRLRDRLGSNSRYRLKLLKSIFPSIVTFQHILVCEKK